MSLDALYAYAVLPAEAAVPPGAPVILPGSWHELVPGGGCAALVSPVPGTEFRPGPAGRFSDLAWVAERERAHRGAIAAAAEHGPVLPLAFGAVFPDEPALAAWLDACGPSLCAALTGQRSPLSVTEELACSLSLNAERDAHVLLRRVTSRAEDAELHELRAEMAQIGLAFGSGELARRLSGA
jgi:hypothetical protein